VDIRSEVDLGTTVTLYLPRSTRPARAAEAEAKTHVAEHRPLKILAVEDNSQVADIGTSLLVKRAPVLPGSEGLRRGDLTVPGPGKPDGLPVGLCGAAHRCGCRWEILHW
jgi:hypothetical protein